MLLFLVCVLIEKQVLIKINFIFLKFFGLEEKTLPEDKDSDPKTEHPGVPGKQTE